MPHTIERVEPKHAGQRQLDAALHPAWKIERKLDELCRVEGSEYLGLQEVREGEEVERAGEGDAGHAGQGGEVPCELCCQYSILALARRADGHVAPICDRNVVSLPSLRHDPHSTTACLRIVDA